MKLSLVAMVVYTVGVSWVELTAIALAVLINY